MKKAYRFDGVDQLEALVKKYGRDHFDFIPDEPGYLDDYKHKGGYIYSTSGYACWTSGEPDTDAQIVTFAEAMVEKIINENPSMEEQVKLAKSYIGKTVISSHGTKFKVENVLIVIDATNLHKFGQSVINFYTLNGYSVVVMGDHWSCQVTDVSIAPSEEVVKLNDTYDAVVTKETIQVGCQTFPISILDDLFAAHEKVG